MTCFAWHLVEAGIRAPVTSCLVEAVAVEPEPVEGFATYTMLYPSTCELEL